MAMSEATIMVGIANKRRRLMERDPCSILIIKYHSLKIGSSKYQLRHHLCCCMVWYEKSLTIRLPLASGTLGSKTNSNEGYVGDHFSVKKKVANL